MTGSDEFGGHLSDSDKEPNKAAARIGTMDLRVALRGVAERLREDIPEQVDRGLAQMREEAPGFFVRDDDPDFVELYRQSYRQHLRVVYAGFESRRPLEEQEPLGLAAEEARLSANFGISLSDVLQTYRIGQRLIVEQMIGIVESTIDDAMLRASVLRTSSRWLFHYNDWVTQRVTEAYERERDLLMRDRDRRRRQLVRDLLDGETVEASQLGYELERDHLAVVAWGQNAERAALALREATGLSLLAISGTHPTSWGWLGGTEIESRHLKAVRELSLPQGARIALGEPARGIEGFRLSHRQAMSAYRIARDTAAPVTAYADVTLLALTLQDAELARDFVIRELGPLVEPDPRSELLRETLGAYFAAGENAASAAAVLGVHDRTVLYRLRSIEDRIGRPISARRDEIAVALRLAPLVLGETAD
jgi:DNA-binding PucR family transcriptional regulator